MRLLHVLAKKNAHIFTRFFQERERLHLTQRCHEQDDYSQICNGRVKISARIRTTTFRDKRICLSSFSFNKKGQNVHVLPFVELHLFIHDEPKVVKFIAWWAVCFLHVNWRMFECATVWCHKLGKYNQHHCDSRICAISKHFLLKFCCILLRATLRYVLTWRERKCLNFNGGVTKMPLVGSTMHLHKISLFTNYTLHFNVTLFKFYALPHGVVFWWIPPCEYIDKFRGQHLKHLNAGVDTI